MSTSPAIFKNAFLEVVSKHSETLIEARRITLTEYTAAIRQLLPEVSGILKLELYNADYYTLDAILYTDADKEHFPISTTYAKYIEVALEHENTIAGSEVEINKLQLFNAPLKVLITYGGPEEKQNYLQRYSEIIQAGDIFQDISYSRRQLVIFGTFLDDIEWEFWEYDGRGFIPV